MLQTLLRIRLDDLWSTEPIDGTAAIGVGWLLVAWFVVGLMWVAWHWKSLSWNADTRSALSFWGVVAVFLGCARVWLWFLSMAVPTPQGIPVYGYGFMLFLGFLAAGWTAGRRAESVRISREVVWDVGMWLFVAGIIGARLFYVIQYRDRVFLKQVDGELVPRQGLELVRAIVNLPDGGLVFYGSVITGILAFALFCRVKQVNPLRLADVIIPSAFIGLAFGRVGCFLNGCCYGDRCELPWGVEFPQGSVPFQVLVDRGFLSVDAAATFALHPTQLYSTLNALILALLTHAYFRYRHRDGAVLAVGWIAYPITRFVIEYLRGDELGRFGTTLTISQWMSLALFASGLAFAAWLNTRPRGEVFPALAPPPRFT
ncbi:MAG: prolipoprotein diacylglyceryl transferase [Planctomycetales bacterium]